MPTAKQPADSAAVETIPGLGPIRARALRKAGWDSAAALRKATIAELQAVPGISEVKARQIFDYVHGSAAVEPAALPPAPPVEGKPPEAEDRGSHTREDHEPTDVPHRKVFREIAAATNALLQSDHVGDFCGRFARQLGKLAFFAEQAPLAKKRSAKERGRIAAPLRKIADALAHAAAHAPLDPKRQEKLADELRDCRRKLKRALRGKNG